MYHDMARHLIELLVWTAVLVVAVQLVGVWTDSPWWLVSGLCAVGGVGLGVILARRRKQRGES